jgi:hypothetical protein
VVGYLRRHHLALLALFVGLGGTSYAAVELSKNSVGAKQIKRSAVRSAEVKDSTLRAEDFMPGQLPAGSNGNQGPAGPKGDEGPAGPSGVVSSRTISGSASSFNLPGNMGGSVVTPAGCRTPTYTAGPGEAAVINMQVTGSPSVATNDVLYLKVMSSANAGAFAAVSGQSQADTLSVSTTHVTNSHVQSLTAGTAYQWGTGLASNAAITMNVALCSGNVTIYRSP